MDVKLKTLLAIEKEGNFTKAAEKLSLTQPAVSQHIKALEEEFNIIIFDRRNRKLSLTKEGELLVRYAKRINALTTNLIKQLELSKLNLKYKKVLVVGITHTLESNIISKAIAIYSSSENAFQIRIVSDTIKNLHRKMKNYEIDLCIINGDIFDKDFEYVTLDDDELLIAVSNSNPLSKLNAITLKQLKKERLILRSKSSDTRILFESHLATKQENIDNFKLILELDNVEVIKELVKDNFGVSVLSKNSCLSEIKKDKFKMLHLKDINMTRQINLYYHKDFPYTTDLKQIISIYHELAK